MQAVNVVLGLGASGCFIAGNFLLHRKRMLMAMQMGTTLLIVQYILLASWPVVIANAILLTRTTLLSVRQWSPRATALLGLTAGTALVLVVVLADGFPVTLGPLLALVAALLNIFALALHNPAHTKTLLALASTCWCGVDVVFGNWQNLFGDGFGVIAAIAGFRGVNARKR